MFLVSSFQSACHAVQMYVSTLGLRSDQQTRECAAKLAVKAAFASLSAFSFPEMPTCEGTHAMTSWVCGGIFLRRLKKRFTLLVLKVLHRKLSTADKLSV